MKDETKDKLKAGAAVGATLGGIGIAAAANSETAQRYVDRKVTELHKRRMGGTPDDSGGSMEDKLERLHRRSKGTPEGDAAYAKLQSLRSRQGKTVGSKIKMTGKNLFRSVKTALGKVIPRKAAMAGHLLSARDQLDGIIQFNLIGDVSDLKRSNLARLVTAGRPINHSHKIGDHASNEVIRRMRERATAAAMNTRPQLIPNKFTVPLSAREKLGGIIELKAADLGYTVPTPGIPDGVTSNQAGPNKRVYPCLYINDCEQDLDLPIEGEARIQYKLRSKTVRRNDVGKKSYSADIEIQNIEPIIDEDEKEEGESTEGDPAKTDIADKLDQIRSDLRHTNKLTLMEKPYSVINFSGEAVGEGIRDALRKIIQRNKSAGAGKVVQRVRQSAEYHPRLIRTAQNKPRKGWYPERGDMSYRSALEGIVELERGDTLYRALPNFPPPMSGRIPIRKGAVASEAATALKKLRKGLVKAPVSLLNGLSARDQLTSIIQFADPRPRNDLGMFSGQEEGPNPNEIDSVYKQPARTIGQNLAGGAVAGVGAAASGTAVKALFEKVKRARKAA